jgi:glycosyltransferase involved in cell wall biosynthesis
MSVDLASQEPAALASIPLGAARPPEGDAQRSRQAEGSPVSGLRVCMLAYTFYETDGRVIRYAEALARSGAQVDAITLFRPGQARRETVQGVEVLRIQGRRKDERSKYGHLLKMLGFFVRSMAVVTREHLRRRYDVVHVHSLPDFEVFAAAIARLLGARLILDIHDLSPEFYANKFGRDTDSFAFRSLAWLERRSVAFADHVIAANDLWHAKLASRTAAAGKLSVFLNYPDRALFHPGRRSLARGNPFTFLYPGSLNRHQGLDIAVRAFARVAGEIPDAEFRIYGEGGAIDEIRALVAELGLQARVLLMPPLGIDHIAQVMADADVGVVPKRDDSFGGEAFSTKILEFMALGVPLIVSATRIDRHYFDDTLVRFFAPGDDADLARAMREAYLDRTCSRELAENALRHVDGYTWAGKQADYLSIVDALAMRRARHAA